MHVNFRLISELFQLQCEKLDDFERTQIEIISVLNSLFKLKASNLFYTSSGMSLKTCGDSELERLAFYLIDHLQSQNKVLADNCSRCLKYMFTASLLSPQMLFEKQVKLHLE